MLKQLRSIITGTLTSIPFALMGTVGLVTMPITDAHAYSSMCAKKYSAVSRRPAAWRYQNINRYRASCIYKSTSYKKERVCEYLGRPSSAKVAVTLPWPPPIPFPPSGSGAKPKCKTVTKSFNTYKTFKFTK